MSAIADAQLPTTPPTLPRTSIARNCPICADSLVAAQRSAFGGDGEVHYLWTCETCGYGFVTKHSMKAV